MMRKDPITRSLISAVLGLILAGCASSGRVGPLPVIPAGSSAAEIIVAREYRFVGSAGALIVVIDGIPIYHLTTDTFVRIRVAPGRHIVGVRGFEERSVELEAAPGQRYSYVIWIGGEAAAPPSYASRRAGEAVSVVRATGLGVPHVSRRSTGRDPPAPALSRMPQDGGIAADVHARIP